MVMPPNRPIMLSDGVLNYLRSLKFDAAAERRSCMIPMGGIYWSDEIPDFHVLMNFSVSDRNLVYRLFSIRFKLWAGKVLSDVDKSYWEAAKEIVPDYPVFHRVEISDDDRAAQAASENEAVAGFQALFEDADNVKFNDDGSFSATFDLTKGKPQSIWKRFLSWCFGLAGKSKRFVPRNPTLNR